MYNAGHENLYMYEAYEHIYLKITVITTKATEDSLSLINGLWPVKSINTVF